MENAAQQDGVMRVILVSENVSMKMGGESHVGYYYFQKMRARGVDAQVVCHARVRDELLAEFPGDADRFHFIEDTRFQSLVWRWGRVLPSRVRDLVLGQLIHFHTMWRARRIVKRLVEKLGSQVVFEPMPISPKGISVMYDLGAPVVIGPMCGGLDFPPAFRFMDSKITRATIEVSRKLSSVLQRIFPGKGRADALLVACARTRDALPKWFRGSVYEVVESGVDLATWTGRSMPLDSIPEGPLRFVFAGRFVDWKGVQYLLDAFASVAETTDAILELIGDGELRPFIESKLATAQLQERVVMRGWLSREEAGDRIRECDVFVMPSLRECGGNAILEAMAMGLPVIATNWAGPGHYVDSTCGITVEPSSPEGFVRGLAEAMIRLAESKELRRQLGIGAQKRVTQQFFDWESKTDRVLEILTEVSERSDSTTRPIPNPS